MFDKRDLSFRFREFSVRLMVQINVFFTYNLLNPNRNDLLTGFIKFFGNVAQVKPDEVFNGCPSVMNLIFQLHSVDDLVISKVSLETIGYIASDPSGKLTINKHYGNAEFYIIHNFDYQLIQFFCSVLCDCNF